MVVSDIMKTFYEDKMYQNELAIAFSLSIPFLIHDGDSYDVAALIYQANFFDENDIECIGYLKYNEGVKYSLVLISETGEDSSFTLIKKADIKIESKQEFERVISRINDLLEEIRVFAFKAPNELTFSQKKTVADYTQLLCTLMPEKLLECYYVIEPLFCDWCCSITLNL